MPNQTRLVYIGLYVAALAAVPLCPPGTPLHSAVCGLIALLEDALELPRSLPTRAARRSARRDAA